MMVMVVWRRSGGGGCEGWEEVGVRKEFGWVVQHAPLFRGAC